MTAAVDVAGAAGESESRSTDECFAFRVRDWTERDTSLVIVRPPAKPGGILHHLYGSR